MKKNERNQHLFETARENSIEVYDDKFGRNSILTRSARMRKFKFYQYKPIRQDTTPTSNTSPKSTTNSNGSPATNTAILTPRDNVLQGKVSLDTVQSEEINNLDNKILQIEKKIADLGADCRLTEIFDLVNEKNDLLRRQMQLNIIQQEKSLEKANEELTKELRSLMIIDDSRKTPAELERQQYLYDQSLALVNKRNELVSHMDIQERAIEEDNTLKERLKVICEPPAKSRDCCIQ